jgi:hypothetical protein
VKKVKKTRVRGLAVTKNTIPADLPIYEENPDPFRILPQIGLRGPLSKNR